MAGSRDAQFTSSDPIRPDGARAFWDQQVFFDGVPRRRREIVPTLAHTPGMTERAARMLLASAPVADGTPPVPPPWFTDAIQRDKAEGEEVREEQIAALERHRARIAANALPERSLPADAQQQLDAIDLKLAELRDWLDNH